MADSVKVSTIRVDMEFERNTPKLNLTLYVPILILLALFLGSILIPSKFLISSNLSHPFKHDFRCALFFPSFLCENKLNTTERGAAEVMFERVTEIENFALNRSYFYLSCIRGKARLPNHTSTIIIHLLRRVPRHVTTI